MHEGTVGQCAGRDNSSIGRLLSVGLMEKATQRYRWGGLPLVRQTSTHWGEEALAQGAGRHPSDFGEDPGLIRHLCRQAGLKYPLRGLGLALMSPWTPDEVAVGGLRNGRAPGISDTSRTADRGLVSSPGAFPSRGRVWQPIERVDRRLVLGLIRAYGIYSLPMAVSRWRRPGPPRHGPLSHVVRPRSRIAVILGK